MGDGPSLFKKRLCLTACLLYRFDLGCQDVRMCFGPGRALKSGRGRDALADGDDRPAVGGVGSHRQVAVEGHCDRTAGDLHIDGGLSVSVHDAHRQVPSKRDPSAGRRDRNGRWDRNWRGPIAQRLHEHSNDGNGQQQEEECAEDRQHAVPHPEQVANRNREGRGDDRTCRSERQRDRVRHTACTAGCRPCCSDGPMNWHPLFGRIGRAWVRGGKPRHGNKNENCNGNDDFLHFLLLQSAPRRELIIDSRGFKVQRAPQLSVDSLAHKMCFVKHFHG